MFWSADAGESKQKWEHRICDNVGTFIHAGCRLSSSALLVTFFLSIILPPCLVSEPNEPMIIQGKLWWNMTLVCHWDLWGGDAAADSSSGRNSHGSTPHSSRGCVLFHSCHCGWLWQFCHVWILIIMNTLNSLRHTGELFQNKFNSFCSWKNVSPSMLLFSPFALNLNGILEQSILGQY